MDTIASDPVMVRVRSAAEASGLSLQELGERMGYDKEHARRSVWQFLNKTHDPRISMLRRFASAIGTPLSELVG
jgi:transcriptional regulator with XRE-family HTH domain